MSYSAKFPTRSNTTILLANLEILFKSAHIIDIKVMLCFGSLLGLVRESRLLPWNNDVELFVWDSQSNQEKLSHLINTLCSHGLVITQNQYNKTISIHTKGGVININQYEKFANLAIRPHDIFSTPKTSSFILSTMYWLTSMLSYRFYCKPSKLYKLLNGTVSVRTFGKVIINCLLSFIPSPARRACFILSVAMFNRLNSYCYTYTSLPAYHFEKTVVVKFPNSEIKMLSPVDPCNLLEFIYGPDWKVPRDAWSFYSSSNKKVSSVGYLSLSPFLVLSRITF